MVMVERRCLLVVNLEYGGGDMSKIKTLVVVGLCLVCLGESWASDPIIGQKIAGNEDLLCVARYGSNTCTVVSNGYVFVEGEYLPAPYTMQRIGQGTVINGILVSDLFKGDPDAIAKANESWLATRYGFKPDTPKRVAEFNIALIMLDLRDNLAIFITAGEKETAKDKEKLVHIATRWTEVDLKRAVQMVISGENERKKLDDLKSLNLGGLSTADEARSFYKKTRGASNLIQRILRPVEEVVPAGSRATSTNGGPVKMTVSLVPNVIEPGGRVQVVVLLENNSEGEVWFPKMLEFLACSVAVSNTNGLTLPETNLKRKVNPAPGRAQVKIAPGKQWNLKTLFNLHHETTVPGDYEVKITKRVTASGVKGQEPRTMELEVGPLELHIAQQANSK